MSVVRVATWLKPLVTGMPAMYAAPPASGAPPDDDRPGLGDDVDRGAERDAVELDLVVGQHAEAPVGDLAPAGADDLLGAEGTVEGDDGVARSLPALDVLGVGVEVDDDRAVAGRARLLDHRHEVLPGRRAGVVLADAHRCAPGRASVLVDRDPRVAEVDDHVPGGRAARDLRGPHPGGEAVGALGHHDPQPGAPLLEDRHRHRVAVPEPDLADLLAPGSGCVVG